jgi:hypothetical protein
LGSLGGGADAFGVVGSSLHASSANAASSNKPCVEILAIKSSSVEPTAMAGRFKPRQAGEEVFRRRQPFAAGASSRRQRA